MRTEPRAPRRVRVLAIGLALLAHAAAVVLVFMERSLPPVASEPALQYFSLWTVPPAGPNQPPVSRPALLSARAVGMIRSPPGPAVAEPLREAAPPDAASLPAQPSVDWNSAAKEAAARIAGNAGRPPMFSTYPQTLRKPCKPRVFDEATKRQMAERLPEPVDPDTVGPDPKANCIMVGGYPKCVQKLVARARKRMSIGDLGTDGIGGRLPGTSVPSTDVCE